ncbi:hypothetical protein ACFYVL_02310 [Streptomyces sp. NPDC004111]|uniref:hypothetical protein n=1 Tax=Streptomyces sp. NPDC004111 TaxID=3364690 RepID=UPI00369F1833
MPFQEKHLWVLPPVESGGRRIKRYHVSPDPAGIPADVEKAAYAILPDLLPPPDGTPPATFVVLHKGGDTGAYINAYSWAWDNALHFDGAAAGQPVLGCPDTDPTHFVRLKQPSDNGLNLFGCVWELPPLLHERNAWVRHMLAPPAPDLDAYLTDSLTTPDTGLGTSGFTTPAG